MPISSSNILGSRLAGLRANREWSLEELAQRADLTRSYLSKLERGVCQPSIATLSKLSQVYGLGVGELLGEQASGEGLRVFRKSTRATSRTTVLLGSLEESRSLLDMYLLRPTQDSRASQRKAADHPGEEAIYVLSGKARLTVAGEIHELSGGDGAWYRAELPHRIESLGRRPAEVLVVAASRRRPRRR